MNILRLAATATALMLLMLLALPPIRTTTGQSANQDQPTEQATDKNLDPNASPPDVPNSAVTTHEVPDSLLPTAPDEDPTEAGTRAGSRPGPVIAVATMPAPSNSFDITVTLTNLSRFSTLGDQDIRAVIIDCHRALQRRSLTIDSVFDVLPSPTGTATVTTGNDPDDVGPAVLTFTGLNFGESAAFGLDPDTWEDPLFDATRADMKGCRVEVVFFGDLRGDGHMIVLANDSVRATIRQRFPSRAE